MLGEGERSRRRWVAVAALLGLAVLIRLALAALGWPEDNSDEATIGLAALHIARDHAHPAYFYGQNYMGTLEAYLGAVAFRALGVSTLALRLGVIGLITAALGMLYLLAVTLYDRRVALLTTGLLTLGSPAMLYNQIIAIGGYPETLLFSTLCLLLSVRLALTSSQPGRDQPPAHRVAMLGAWGLSAGLGLWSHLLILPLVAASASLLALFCRRMGPWGLSWLLAGLLVGGAPMLLHDATAAPGHRSFAAAVGARAAGGTSQAAPAPWHQRIAGTLLISLPHWTGTDLACRILPNPRPARPPSPTAVPCAAVPAATSSGLIALWTLSAWHAARRTRSAWTARQASGGQRELARQTGRLALLGSAGTALALYATSPAPAVVPLTSVRYLTCLLIATPAILAPLLEPADRPPA